MRARSAAPLLLLSLVAACDRHADAGRTASAAGSVALAVEPRLLQFDPIPFGGRAQGSYRLRNATRQPLRIQRIGPTGCGCAVPVLELPGRQGADRTVRLDLGPVEVLLQPAEEAILHLTLDTSRFREPVSRRHGSFPIVLEGHAPVVLEYAADIWTPVQVEPWAVDLGRVAVRSQPTATVLVQGHDAAHFHVLAPEQIEGWRLEAVPLPADEVDTWRLSFTAPAVLPEGPFRQEFRVPLDVPDALPIRVTVFGFGEGDLAWTPSRLVFPPEGHDLVLELTLRFRAHGQTLPPPEAELRREDGGPPTPAVEVHEVEPGHVFRVRVTRPGGPPAVAERGELLLRTGWSEEPEVRVPYLLVPLPQDDGG